MSTSPARRGYHHGDLRPALIRSALEMLAESEPGELSLRAVARRAKVSAMAPYRHFADKEALLAAVAEHGFRELATRLTAATATAAPREGLIAQGVAYVLFSRDQPSLFKLMFGPAVAQKSAYPALSAAADAAFGALRQAVEALGSFAGERAVADAALASWSLVHGLATLLVDCGLAREDDGIEAVADRVTRLLVDGLAPRAETDKRTNSAIAPSHRRAPARRTRRIPTTS